MYLSSTSVKVFPLGRPRSNSSLDITSRIFYEQNVANLIKQLIDTQGFIINDFTIDTNGRLSSELEINIGGYYFKINNSTQLLPLNENNYLINSSNSPITNANPAYIYACIDLTENNTTTSNPLEIIGQDSDNLYQGLIIEASTTSPETYLSHTYQVPILDVITDSNGTITNITIHQNSYFKFDTQSLNITGIDGQH